MRTLYAIALSFSLLLPAAAQDINGQPNGVISGTVTSSITGMGIADVDITLYTRQAVRYPTKTDGNGRFRVTGIAPGAYEVLFEKDGYRFDRKIPSEPYVIGPGQDSLELRLTMTRPVTVSGRVLDDDDSPVVGAQVSLGGIPVITDEEGAYTIGPSPPGFYRLVAVPPTVSASLSDSASPVDVSTDDERVEAVPTYYPSALDPAAAQLIAINSDQDLAGYDIRLHREPVFSVSGKIIDIDGNPGAKATVYLFPVTRQSTRLAGIANGTYLTLLAAGEAIGSTEFKILADDTGEFVFPSGHSGQWYVRAELTDPMVGEVFEIRSLRAAEMNLTVGRGDVSNLELRLAPPLQISGAAEFDGIDPQPAVLRLLRTNTGNAGNVLFFNEMGAPVGTPGTGAIAGMHYVAPMLLREGFAPRAAMMNGRNVLYQPVDINAPGEITVVYEAANGTVRGEVSGEGLWVVLIPQNLTTFGYGRMVRVADDGTFQVSGLAEGNYLAAAFTGPEVTNWLTPQVIAMIESRGQRVRIEKNGSATVRLAAIRWFE